MNSELVVGIDASRANKEQKTGVEFYAFHLIEELKQLTINDQQLTIVLYSDKPLTGELAKLPPNWQSKVLPWPPQLLWTQIRLSWEMMIKPPDVLFIPAHAPPIIHPPKTVMTVHDVAAARFPESYSWFERWYSIWSAKYAVKKLWKIIVPSEFTKNEIIKTFPPEADQPMAEKHKNIKTNKIFVVPHGYDQRYRVIADQGAINSVLTHYNIRRPFILSVGRWETKKNTARLIEAFNKFSYQLSAISYQLVLIGKPGHGFGRVKEACGHSPYKDRIIMPGYVEPSDLVYIMNAAEAFVFPSLYEGFGLPVLEAMAGGTPVVAGQGSSLEEVGGEACIYVDPLDADDIARGINKVIQNSECKMQNVAAGLKRVNDFSWERCARKTLTVLTE